MRPLIFGIIFFTFLQIDYYSFAEDKPEWVDASGEAAGSEMESPHEVCERAKVNAQRKAREQAVGTFIKSHTLVSNGQLTEDLIFVRVRGKIEKLEVMGQTISNSVNSCSVRVKALISPVYPKETDSIIIKAALTRSVFKDGEEVGIQYQVNTESYVYIFIVGADNSVTQLLPNNKIQGNFAIINQSYEFPPINSSIHLKAMLLPETSKIGTDEKVKIIATRHPEPLLEKAFRESFAAYDLHSTGLISDLLKRLNQLDPSEWGDKTLSYHIAPAVAK